MNVAYLSLGSNIEPEKNIVAAVERLSDFGNISAVSTVWETLPDGDPNQDNYLNACITLTTQLDAWDLRRGAIETVESALARTRDPQNRAAARTIDIDIMLFNSEIISMGRRSIPDAEVLERPFVAIPLAEIAPNYVHPQTNQTLAEIASTFRIARHEMWQRPDVSLISEMVG